MKHSAQYIACERGLGIDRSRNDTAAPLLGHRAATGSRSHHSSVCIEGQEQFGLLLCVGGNGVAVVVSDLTGGNYHDHVLVIGAKTMGAGLLSLRPAGTDAVLSSNMELSNKGLAG
jgi:hypothetical protein